MSQYENAQYKPYPHMNTKRPILTWVVIAINVLLYVVMAVASLVFKIDSDILLILFGAKVNEFIDIGQVWRLLTCTFLHVGIAHLLCNCYAIFVYGPLVERLYGRARFVIIYLISGIAGSVLSYSFSTAPSVGASGAIFGLIGCMFYFREQHPELFSMVFGKRLFVVLGINLLIGLIQPGIDIYGHIGGFLGGFMASWITGLYKENVKPSKRGYVVLLLILLLTGCVALGKFLGI
ncbi:MAG: rhomboid family intramembrane serine protease [Clostridiales bacterium]|nr:rhomboid family intramembrane serine protease [Clostridiales bacterium]